MNNNDTKQIHDSINHKVVNDEGTPYRLQKLMESARQSGQTLGEEKWNEIVRAIYNDPKNLNTLCGNDLISILVTMTVYFSSTILFLTKTKIADKDDGGVTLDDLIKAISEGIKTVAKTASI